MRGFGQILTATLLAAGVALAGGAAHAGKFKVIHSFCEGQHQFCGDGSNPQGALVMDAAGNFYGTAATGGRGVGTVFELERKPGGGLNFKTIYRFCSNGFCGRNPSGGLIVDTQGNLYGTANNLIFELSPGAGKKGRWGEKIIYQFCSQNCANGSLPVSKLAYAGQSSGAPYDGSSPIYGVTAEGGANGGGTVFQLANSSGSWTQSVLYSFCSTGGSQCTDGKNPVGGLVLDSTGNLYGIANMGGNVGSIAGGAGTVFELTSKQGKWSETVLYTFCSVAECADGAFPVGSLVLDSIGNLFGATAGGGNSCPPEPSGCGTIFKLVPNGIESQEIVLYAFCQKTDCRDGHTPQAGVFLDSSGNLFGTTFQGGGNDGDEFGVGGGTVFKLSGSAFKVLYRFCSSAACADGEYPTASVTSDGSGRLLGTTELGGSFAGSVDGGVIFELDHK